MAMRHNSSNKKTPIIRSRHRHRRASTAAVPCIWLLKGDLVRQWDSAWADRRICQPLIEGILLPANREFVEQQSPKNLIGRSCSRNYDVVMANHGLFAHVLVYREKLAKACDLEKSYGETIKKLNIELEAAVEKASEA